MNIWHKRYNINAKRLLLDEKGYVTNQSTFAKDRYVSI